LPQRVIYTNPPIQINLIAEKFLLLLLLAHHNDFQTKPTASRSINKQKNDLGNTPLGEGGSHGKVGSFTRFRAFVPPARVSTELVVQIAPSAFGPRLST
jgi:hypothetical protein